MKLLGYALALTLSTTVVIAHYSEGQNIPKLTVVNILSIRPGMTEEQVKSRIGIPAETSTRTSQIYCKCNPKNICSNAVTYTFEYLNRGDRNPYPLMWVHFDESHLVKEVFIKKYVPAEVKSWSIYRVNRALCDTIDEYFPLDPEARADSLKQFFE